MPIYAYRCDACGHGRDVLQKMSDAPLTDCTSCGATGTFKKQLTAAGFQLKGSGWYATDFRGGSSATAPAADGATADSGSAAAAAPSSGDSSAPASTASTSAAGACGSACASH